MKKLLSIILTAAISATTSISAFANDKTNITVYNTANCLYHQFSQSH